jgi:hypothetical protein
MSLSILCVTNNEHEHVQDFILRMREDADELGAELVLGLDRERAQQATFRALANKALDLTADKLQEDVLDQAVNACTGEWVLRLDDDEAISPALCEWLKSKAYERVGSKTYTFPRIYMYPDKQHYLVNKGIYPDLQTRLGLRTHMTGYNTVHSGNPNGPGKIVPYALEHHKLLVRDFDSRMEIAKRYESLRKGAGSARELACYNLPEKVYPELLYVEYVNNGNFALA